MDREDAELPIFAEGSVRRRRAWTVLTMRLAALFKPLYSVTHSSALHSPVPSPLHSVPKERVGWFPSLGMNGRRRAEGQVLQEFTCLPATAPSLRCLCRIRAQLVPSGPGGLGSNTLTH